jgi:hypothetical protein
MAAFSALLTIIFLSKKYFFFKGHSKSSVTVGPQNLISESLKSVCAAHIKFTVTGLCRNKFGFYFLLP